MSISFHRIDASCLSITEGGSNLGENTGSVLSDNQHDWVVEYNGAAIKSIRTGFYSALERAGIQGVNIHQIRHTVAVQMLEAEESIEKVSDFLGHSNIHITKKTYARFQPEHLASAAAALDFLDDS